MSGGLQLEAQDLAAAYGRAQVLFGVSLALAPGEVLALVGRNGAGKSTTLKAIMGLVPATGTVRLGGQDIARLPAFERARLGLGYVPEDRRIFTDLTVLENLETGRRPPRSGRAPFTEARLFAMFPNLAEMRHRRGGAMSGGEQQMLALARTLMGNPAVLLLDEPSEGLAPRIVAEMAKAVAALKAEGLSILVSEQNVAFTRAIADRALLIERGAVRAAGSVGEIEARLAADALGTDAQ
ncbi:ABC transporter ATP-binding protein [Xanthobacter tagetidis]|uniref:ABC transporter ATP-binding protein n=1 Tax=Xanthobacter tagetidis TaxID=60216 RepID=A0A3L7A2K1_9HYPH|nr:ABC transporter ATP-binding protein [Xanthobacter tagetidis]MBB6309272.1 branched-chain amino acid transport system ATP-binding protein [Xanthobacter tagetidis]RLP74228.1 ABC transporter ATP-binding protein [Xanthobacter tagetidis]